MIDSQHDKPQNPNIYVPRQLYSENMRPAEASKYTGISVSKLAKLRMKGQRHESPPFIKAAGCVIYRKSDLDAWLDVLVVQVA